MDDLTVTPENLHTIWIRTSDGRNVNLRDATDAEFVVWALSRMPAWSTLQRVSFCNALQRQQGPLVPIREDISDG